jgi:DNA-binding helix-hairpin-helix protein with protein kinase domain
MMGQIVFAGGKQLTLDKLVGRGGEGEVYLVAGRNDLAAKLYTLSDLRSREAKVDLLVKSRLAERTKQVAFPIAAVREKNGQFRGFLMPLVSGSKPLHELYAPSSRKRFFPKADYRFLAHTASNVAKAVAQVHATNCVIGDINHSGILVSQKAVAAMIDADSFQVRDANTTHFCKVGVPEYTPPELQGMNLDQLVRTPNHDNFGLAIVIFQLLFMGRHPFMGRYSGSDEMPIERAISEHRFAYSRSRATGMEPPPGASTLDDVPKKLAEYFERAFSPEGEVARPTAAQWVEALHEFEKSLVKCKTSKLHFHSRAAKTCPWCRMERELRMILFVPEMKDYAAKAFKFDTSAIVAAMKKVEALDLAGLSSLAPVLPQKAGRVSLAVRTYEKRKTIWRWSMLVVPAIAALLAAIKPSSWPFFIASGAIALGSLYAREVSVPVLQNARKQAQEKFDAAMAAWHERLGLQKIGDDHRSLRTEHDGYIRLKNDHEQRLREIMLTRNDRELKDYLDTFEIAKAKDVVKGLGPAKITALTSYGIETFADVTKAGCLAAPGVGHYITEGLLEHRAKLESQFKPKGTPSAMEVQERMLLDLETSAKAKAMETKILGLSSSFQKQVSKTRSFAGKRYRPLVKAFKRIANIDAGVAYLNAAPPRLVSMPNPGLVRTTTVSASSATCPTCGSEMVATRRNGGALIWGCRKYPYCSGTKPYS